MASRRINLLPPDLAQKRRLRQIGAAIGAAGLALVAVLALVYIVQEVRLRGERGRLELQEDRNAEVRAQIAQLRDFGELQEQVEAKTQLLEDLAADEVRWSVVLADISLVIPADVWLTQFTAQLSGEEGQVGGIQLAGTTFSHVDVATWLARLARVEGFTAPYLSLSTKSSLGSAEVVDFSSTVQLSEQALRRNQRGAQRQL